MSLARAVVRSPRGRLVLAAVVIYLAWQVWLGVRAPGKVAPELSGAAAPKVDVVVTLPFAPERFHVIALQKFGRVSGTVDHEVELRGVRRSDLSAVARPYWVRRIEPLPTGR